MDAIKRAVMPNQTMTGNVDKISQYTESIDVFNLNNNEYDEINSKIKELKSNIVNPRIKNEIKQLARDALVKLKDKQTEICNYRITQSMIGNAGSTTKRLVSVKMKDYYKTLNVIWTIPANKYTFLPPNERGGFEHLNDDTKRIQVEITGSLSGPGAPGVQDGWASVPAPIPFYKKSYNLIKTSDTDKISQVDKLPKILENFLTKKLVIDLLDNENDTTMSDAEALFNNNNENGTENGTIKLSKSNISGVDTDSLNQGPVYTATTATCGYVPLYTYNGPDDKSTPEYSLSWIHPYRVTAHSKDIKYNVLKNEKETVESVTLDQLYPNKAKLYQEEQPPIQEGGRRTRRRKTRRAKTKQRKSRSRKARKSRRRK